MTTPTQKQKLHKYLSEVEATLPPWPLEQPEFRMVKVDGYVVKQLREGRVVLLSRPMLRSILDALATKPRSPKR